VRRLILVRHARVALSSDAPPHEWRLTLEGRADAERLAGAPVLDGVSLVVTSPEPKACATAEPIARRLGAVLREDADLREAERGASSVDDRAAFVARVDGWFGGRRVDGWEARDRAAARIQRCIGRLLDEWSEDLAVVSHGTVLSLYLAALRGQPRVSLEEWRAIPLPAVAVVDPVGRRVVESWTGV
jgi:broad specificity phosphatase PhoE